MKKIKLLSLFIVLLLSGVNLAQQVGAHILVESNSGNQTVKDTKSIKNLFEQMLNPVLLDTKSMLDSAIVTKEDGTKERHIYTYTNESFMNWSTYLWQSWNGNEWSNFMVMTYSYDANGHFVGGLGKIWIENQWQNYLKYTLSYEGNMISSSIIEMWISENWITTDQSTISYDETNHTSTEISQGSFMGYSYNTKTTTTYDAYDNIISELIEENNGGNWVNSELTTYEYNSDNNKTSELISYWGSNNNWQNEFAITYTYDNNKNRIMEESKMWAGSSWENDSKTSITFDSNNYMTLNLISFWDGNNWENYNRFSYNYSRDGRSFHGLSEYWDTQNWLLSEGEFHFFDTKGWYTEYETHGQSYLFDGTEIDAYFAIVTNVKTDDLTISNFSLSQNYPNPFNPSTTIQFAIPKAGMVSLKVYNILGEEVAELINKEINAGLQSVKFDASSVRRGISSGIYFYKLQSGSFVESKKMILIK